MSEPPPIPLLLLIVGTEDKNLLGTTFVGFDALFVLENGEGNKLSPNLRIDCDSVAKAPLGVAGLATSTVRSALCGSGLPPGEGALSVVVSACAMKMLKNRSLSLSS